MKSSKDHLPSAGQLEYWQKVKTDRELFFSNFDLILAHQQDILACDQYFFCRPAFAGYGIYCSKSITLGTLLLGWRSGILIEPCPIMVRDASLKPAKEVSCGGKSYVYHFGGLPSGTGWLGYCTSCGGSQFTFDKQLPRQRQRFEFARQADSKFRDWAEGLELEHFPTCQFSFAEPAIVPATKARIRWVKLPLVEAVNLEQLIKELRKGPIRRPLPDQIISLNNSP